MLPTIVSIQSLLLGMGVLLAGSGLLATLLGLRAHAAGFSDLTIGLIMSGFYLGYVLGTSWMPRLIRRVGHIRSFAAMAAISCVTAILHGLIVDPWAWLVLRVISGISVLGLYMVIESWLNEQVGHHHQRGQIFSIYMMVTLLALGSGQFLIGIYGPLDLGSFALVGLLFALGLVPVALTRAIQPTPLQTDRLSARTLYRMAPAGTLGALLSGTITGALWGMAAVYANRIGLPDHQVAWFVALLIFGGALLQWPLGKLSDHYDRRLILILVAAAGGLASLALLVVAPMAVHTPSMHWLLWPATLLFGGFAFSLYAISVAQVHDRLNPDQVLEATRSLLLLNGVGASVGPLLSGLMMGRLGSIGFPLFGLLILLVLAALISWRIRLDAPVPTDERGEFVMTTRTSMAAADFDPRNDELHETEPERGEGNDAPVIGTAEASTEPRP